MKVGYIRVSTTNQNTIRQEVLMEELGVEKIFIDKTSGKNTDRPALDQMLEFIREGDTLIVESYSRLARSSADLLKIVERLNARKVSFISIKENIDTTTPQGRLMLTLFAGIYEFERECMLDRQREGIEIAKAKGKYKGRKPLQIDEKKFSKVYSAWKAGETTATAAMREMGIKKTTFYRRVAEYEGR